VFKGFYNITNYVIKDDIIPFMINTEACLEARFIGRSVGMKNFEHFFTVKGFGSIKKRII